MNAQLALLGAAMGIGATAVLDLWGLALKAVFGWPTTNWGLVGRWFLHLPSGTWRHDAIGAAPSFQNERAAGWIAHYAVGMVFGLVTVAIGGAAWAAAPTWPLPLAVGLVTIGCGWFILQPGMGAGFAASRRPDRVRVRILNVVGHTVFGLAMWGVAVLLAR